MDIKRYLKGLPVVAALLLTASCSNEESEIVKAPQPEGRIIPFEATAISGSQTRATVSSEKEGCEYRFEDGDKLYVWGTDIYGELTLTDGAGGTSATFKGNLIYSGEGDPDNSLTLNAVIKGPNDQILGTLAEFKGRDYQPAYTTGLATATTCNSEAVQKFSHITATSNYLSKDFSFYQQSTFITFNITLEDGTADEDDINVTISSGSGDDKITRTGTVKAFEESGVIKAKFTAGFPGGTTLDNATITLGTRDAISFGGTATLYNNTFYQVTKTYTRYKITASAMGKEKDIASNQPLPTELNPFTLTVAEVLSKYPTYASYASNVTNCQYTSGNGNVSVTGTAPDYTLNATGTGSSIFTVTVDMSGFPISIPVTITVAKMTPPTP